MNRQYFGIGLVVCSLLAGLVLLMAVVKGDRAMEELTAAYGERSGFEWYQHEAAREVFEGELRSEAEVLYFASFWGGAVLVAGLVGLGIGCVGGRRRLAICCGVVGAIALVLLPMPWVFYGESIDAVSFIVE